MALERTKTVGQENRLFQTEQPQSIQTGLQLFRGATHSKASKHLAGLAVGLCLTFIHLIRIPVTNTSVNPARSTGQALFAGDWGLGQL